MSLEKKVIATTEYIHPSRRKSLPSLIACLKASLCPQKIYNTKERETVRRENQATRAQAEMEKLKLYRELNEKNYCAPFSSPALASVSVLVQVRSLTPSENF